MSQKDKNFDVLVVGAGPSGMMAAISAAEAKAKAGIKVALIDKNKKVGKKLYMTGGGRCNVTNSGSTNEIISNLPGNGRFLHSAFSQFSNQDIIHFFEKNGVTLKEEDHGRMFPTTNKSKTIVDCLFDKILNLDVHYYPEESARELLLENGAVTAIRTEHDTFKTKTVILSTGGRAYPSTGSTGDGYQFARLAGHSITPLYATESALISSESFIKDKTLQGISLHDIELSVLNAKGKVIVKQRHDLLFTHFGLSGPAALRASGFINKQLSKGEKSVTVSFKLFPDKSFGDLKNEISGLLKSDKSAKNALSGLIQERLLIFLLNRAEISNTKPAKAVTPTEMERLTQNIQDFKIKIDGTFPIEKSFVTGGGVSLKEIRPKSLESKLVKGLYMTGELLDINGYTGGYNVTCAFVTGWVAGHHAAISLQN